MKACPDLLVLAQATEPGARAGVLAHAVACPRCRSLLMDLAAPEAPLSPAAGQAVREAARRPVPRVWTPLAAAALLFVALALWGQGRAKSTPIPSPGQPPSSSASPVFLRAEGMLEASSGDLSLLAGRASSLSLKAGSRARVLGRPGGPELVLLEGALWLEDPGEPVTLRVAGALVHVEKAVLLLEVLPPVRPSGVFRFPEAWASEEAGVRLALLTGSARVRTAEGEIPLQAGQELLLRPGMPGGPRPLGPLSWRGDRDWQGLEGLPRVLGTGEHPLARPAGREAYVWEALFRRTDPASAAALCFAAGDRGWRVPLGVPWAEGGGLLRMRLELRQGWVRLLAGPYEILRKPLAELQIRPGSLDPAAPRCGLKVWGGSVEVLESRWREGR